MLAIEQWLHRMKEVADTFAASPDPDLLRLEQLKRGLQDTFDTLKRLDEELIVHVDAADVNREIEDSEHIKDEMFAAMGHLLVHLCLPLIV